MCVLFYVSTYLGLGSWTDTAEGSTHCGDERLPTLKLSTGMGGLIIRLITGSSTATHSGIAGLRSNAGLRSMGPGKEGVVCEELEEVGVGGEEEEAREEEEAYEDELMSGIDDAKRKEAGDVSMLEEASGEFLSTCVGWNLFRVLEDLAPSRSVSLSDGSCASLRLVFWDVRLLRFLPTAFLGLVLVSVVASFCGFI